MDTRRPWNNAKAFWSTRWKWLASVAVLILEEIFVGVLQNAAQWLWTLRGRTLGEGGILVVAVFVLALTWATIDPVGLWRTRRQVARRVRHSEDEKRAIDDIRVLWDQAGKPALEGALVLLDRRSRILREYCAYAWLLDRVATKLNGHAASLKAALADDDPEPLPEVIRRLAEVSEEYGRCAAWMNRCAFDLPGCTKDEYATYDEWVARHQDFYTQLEVLKSRKAFKGRLAAEINPDARRYRHQFDDFTRVKPLTHYADTIAVLQEEAAASKREVERRDEAVRHWRKRCELRRVPLDYMEPVPWEHESWLDGFPPLPRTTTTTSDSEPHPPSKSEEANAET